MELKLRASTTTCQVIIEAVVASPCVPIAAAMAFATEITPVESILVLTVSKS